MSSQGTEDLAASRQHPASCPHRAPCRTQDPGHSIQHPAPSIMSSQGTLWDPGPSTQHPASCPHRAPCRTQDPGHSTQHPASCPYRAPRTQDRGPSTQHPASCTQHPVLRGPPAPSLHTPGVGPLLQGVFCLNKQKKSVLLVKRDGCGRWVT